MYDGIYSAKKKKNKWNNAFSSNMDGTRGYQTKSKNKRERKTNILWYHLYMESKIWHKQSYFWNSTYETETDSQA